MEIINDGDEKRVVVQPEDWKLNALVHIPHEDIKEDSIFFENRIIRIYRPEDRIIGYAHVVDVLSNFDEYADMKNAFYGSMEILERFLDRLSFATFQPCSLVQPTGITRYEVEINQEFEILIPDDISKEKPQLELKLSEYTNLDATFENIQIEHSLKEFRLALESISIVDKFLHYYNAIERVAELTTQDYATNNCNSCGKENKLPFKATAKTITTLFLDDGLTKKDFKLCRKIRAKIAHGSANRNKEFQESVLSNLLKVERIAANSISKISSIDIISGKIPRFCSQFWAIKGIKSMNRNATTNASYQIISHKFEFNAIFNKVNDIEPEDKEFKPMTEPIPAKLDPEYFDVYPYSWPN